MIGLMAEHVFESPQVEEFYNAYHSKADGRFTFSKGGKRGKIHVPMSEGARSSNAILRRLASDRKSKEYKTAKKNMSGSWADREKGQGGTGRIKGSNSKKADEARASNAKKGAKTIRLKKDTAAARAAMKFKNESYNQPGPSKTAMDLTRRFGGRP